MEMLLDARKLPEGERVEYWRLAMHKVLQARCHIEPAGNQSFEATMGVLPMGPWNMVEITGTAHTSHRDGPGAEGWVSLMCQLEGLGRMQEKEREALLRPGDICVVAPDRDIVSVRHGRFRQLVVNVPEAELDEALPEWRELTATRLQGDRPEVRAASDLLRYAADHHASLGHDCRAQLAVCVSGLLGGLARSKGAKAEGPPSRLATYHRKRVERFVEEHLCDPDLDVPTIARELRLSVRYVHKLFAGQQLSLMQWVQQRRLQACQRDLAARGSRPVSNVAYAWGFTSAAHFSRVFKQRFGVSPSQA